jgi:hypothetical protein
MNWYYIEKEYYDYADDIEGVNIHYVWTPLGSEPDWEHQRVTRFMPHARSSPLAPGASVPSTAENDNPPLLRLRKKILKLPLQIFDFTGDAHTTRYALHHYFEVFQDGHRHYSPLYTEEINTEVQVASLTPPANGQESSSTPLPTTAVDVKELKLGLRRRQKAQ